MLYRYVLIIFRGVVRVILNRTVRLIKPERGHPRRIKWRIGDRKGAPVIVGQKCRAFISPKEQMFEGRRCSRTKHGRFFHSDLTSLTQQLKYFQRKTVRDNLLILNVRNDIISLLRV